MQPVFMYNPCARRIDYPPVPPTPVNTPARPALAPLTLNLVASAPTLLGQGKNNDKLVERYRIYLERKGVTAALTDALVALFDATDTDAHTAGLDSTHHWPGDPIEFILKHLGCASQLQVDVDLAQRQVHTLETELTSAHAQLVVSQRRLIVLERAELTDDMINGDC